MESRRQPNFWTFSISHPKQCWIVFLASLEGLFKAKVDRWSSDFLQKRDGFINMPKTFKSQKCTPKYEFHSVRSSWLKKNKTWRGGVIRPCFHHTPKFGRKIGLQETIPQMWSTTSHGFEWFDIKSLQIPRGKWSLRVGASIDSNEFRYIVGSCYNRGHYIKPTQTRHYMGNPSSFTLHLDCLIPPE